MKVILSHVNLDFDGLASMIAAKKLYPDAKLVIPSKQGKSVERFLAIYRDSFNLYFPTQINWNEVTEIIMVDIASLQRIGEVHTLISNDDSIDFIVYDHHQVNENDVQAKYAKIEQVGATITLLVEEIIEKKIPISSFEATIFALGLYTDTGSFTYQNTTSRDLAIGGYLIEKGANLQILVKFAESPLQEDEQQLLHSLLQHSEEIYINGVDILIATHQQKNYTGGLALLARKALEMTGTDALLFIVEMGKRIFIVGRSTTDRVDILPIIKLFGGGGHQKSASAMIKNGDFTTILQTVKRHVHDAVKPSITAKDIMASPVKVIDTNTTIEEAQKMMHRYGHTGFPVLDNGHLVGIISRRDIDKAKHHGLGHAPVKAYMSINPVTIQPHMSMEEIQNVMIDKNIGRLPVVDKGSIIGIISRTNVIEALHGEKIKRGQVFDVALRNEISLVERMSSLFSPTVLKMIDEISNTADKYNTPVFMIGGVVRDLIIGRKNEDIDIVIEGDGIAFANILAEKFGGTVRRHEKFGTATWKHVSGHKIDITSARTEYYEHPAALPTVEMSSLQEDLLRRDFTINAMAIQLNNREFKLIDYFHGFDDIMNKTIRTLYNLSFVEDPTRILRAVRFEQRFGFKMDKQTLDLAQISVDKIASTSKPRLAHELAILLQEEYPVEALIRLNEIGVIQNLIGSSNHFDSLKNLERFKQLLDEIEVIVPEQKLKQNWICYLTILFSFRKDLLETVKEFALNNHDLKLIEEITDLLSLDLPFTKNIKQGDMHFYLKKFSIEAICCIISMKQWESEVNAQIFLYIQKREQLATLIKGNDLQLLNIKPGPIYSEIILFTEAAYLNELISTKEDALQLIRERFLS